MPKSIPILILTSLLAVVVPEAHAARPPRVAPDLLACETEGLRGWIKQPQETAAPDTTTFHGGAQAARLVRDADSSDTFSILSRKLSVDFVGQDLELRGWLRTEDATTGAGIWLRQDGGGRMIRIDNMARRRVRGTTPWARYSITQPLDPGTEEIIFGAITSGEGSMWADDFELLVDGVPLNEVPVAERFRNVLDRDIEFDQASGIELSSLSAIQTDAVALLGRVWGFLKYHHPRIAAGDLHWDAELFRVLSRVLDADSPEAVRDVLTAWVVELGPAGPCDPCATAPQDASLRADLAWLQDEDLLGAELPSLLGEVAENRFAGAESFYIRMHQGVRNPDFLHELPGPASAAQDAGYRILGVLRFWNIIAYWFPYRDLIDEPWEEVLHDAVGRMAAATDPGAYELEMQRLIARVDDTHANLWSVHDLRPPVGEGGWPVQFRMVDNRPTVAAFTDQERGPATGLELGDQVLAIDGRSVAELLEESRPFACGSNRAARERDQLRGFSRGPVGAAAVRLERAGAVVELEIPRVPNWQGRRVLHDRPGPTFQNLSDEIAYLKLSGVKNAEMDSYLEQASGSRGLVVDIRNYPSEFVVFTLAPPLLEEPTAFARFTRGDPANPGTFVMGEPLALQPVTPRYEGNVAILVDESSISQAEYTAMALRAGPRSVVVGSTTAGADGNVSKVPLPGGLSLYITGIGVFHPDGSATQQIGIVPDIEARPTAAGLRAQRDEVLEAAVRHLLGEGADEAEVREMCRRPGS